MDKAVFVLVAIHLVYYLYFFFIDYIIKMSRNRNINPSTTILRLMTEHKVDVRMFSYNGQPYGFAWIRTIWINTKVENLRKKNKKPDFMVKWAFFHELYHVRNNHKALTLLMRFGFALIPFVLLVSIPMFVMLYMACAYGMYEVNESFESKADAYANEMMKIPKTIISEGNN